LKPLIRLMREDGRFEIILTTTTSTAHALAARAYARDIAFLAYFPLDFWPISRRVWEIVQPDGCILMEAEIWPEHLHQAWLRQVPVFLINARMSERSFGRWSRMPAGIRAVFSMLHRIVAASEEDGQRFVDLGAPEDRVLVSGNLKLDFDPAPILGDHQVRQLQRELGLFDSGDGDSVPLILVGASTWPGEEEMLLRVWERLRDQDLACRLLLVPRHAERGKALREIFARSGRVVHFRTDGMAPGPVEVTVADTTGEMVRLLQAADLVFVGKSMGQNRGGQNPIEAAALGKPVLFGPNMQNFRSVAQSMLEKGAALQVNDEEELLTQVTRLFRTPQARESQGRAARKWHETGKGATERTFTVLREALLGQETGSGQDALNLVQHCPGWKLR